MDERHFCALHVIFTEKLRVNRRLWEDGLFALGRSVWEM
ncbi:hypothetical protein NBRC3293_0327 [Gluconobacter oxydans NBRC 3293]|uniref:Uncharacterized protein n=1 Tax=Gluconobacter oxydans NBRC 3293 TaxID=1315969 RepID=A0A829WZC5_GLUOY|nr:hypothetical protein NBRC3293_0327 [Gluconobacter oxydans NBRC 3293]